MHHMTTPTHSQQPLFQDQKPVRVTVPVPPDVLEAFRRLADVQGVSVGRAMGEWLTDTLDGVNALTDIVAKAKKTPHLAARQLHAYAVGMVDHTADLLEHIRAGSASGSVAQTKTAGERGPRPRGVARQPSKVEPPPQERISGFLADLSAGSPKVAPPWGNTGGKVPKKTTKVVRKRGGKGS